MKNKKVCLIFDLRMPMFLRDFTILEIGKGVSYYDYDRTKTSFLNHYERSIQPLFETLQDPSISIKASVFFSGNFLRLLQENFPNEVDRIRNHVLAGNLQIIGGTYSNTVASLYSLDVFSRDVKRHQDIVLEILGVRPDVFMNTENIFSDQIGKLLLGHNYRATFSDLLPWYLNGGHPRQVFRSSFEKNFKILIMEHSQLLAEDQNSDKWKIVKMNPYTETQGKDWSERISQLTSGYTSHTVDEALNGSRPSLVFSASSPIGGVYRGGLDGITKNPMQKKALETIFSLEEEVLNSGDEQLIHDWMGLSNVEYLIGMNPNWIEGSRPYDIFIRYMNILTDIKLRLT